MQIRQLEYFVSLCETLNFTRTAAEFFVSQTAVTQQIKALEEELGTILFNRTKRHVELTSAGKLLHEDAKAILFHVHEARQHIRTHSGEVSGTLKVGFLRGYEHEGLSRALNDFHNQYPQVSLSLMRGSVNSLFRELRNGKIDLIFTHRYRDVYDDFVALDIREYPLMVLCPIGHPLARNPFVRPEELKGYRLVDVEKPTDEVGEASSVTRFFLNAGFLPELSFVSDDIDTNIVAVTAGLGYALLPSYLTDHLVEPTSVEVRPVLGHEAEMTVSAIWRKNDTSQLIARFLDVCVAHLNR